LLQQLALPITIGSVHYPGVKIHDARIIRLLEVLLHDGNTVGGWTAEQIHSAILTTVQLSAKVARQTSFHFDPAARSLATRTPPSEAMTPLEV
jgi:hypothetical protein